jgi:pimeloyl-ACP methyl ester carboxylesterase
VDAHSPPASRRVRLRSGLSLHLLEWEAGPDGDADHTVLLLHGFLDHGGGFRALVDAGLGGRVHVVAPDLRGHGDSDRVGAGGYYHFFDYLADVEGVVEQTARARLSVIGHSMGGMVAGYFVGTFPERVTKLALLEGMGPPATEDTSPARVRGWLAGWARQAGRAPRRMTLDEAAARLRENDPLLDEEGARREAALATRPSPDGATVEWKHDPLHLTTAPYAFRLEVAERFWAEARCPVLLVEGERSLFRFDEAEAARRRACFTRAPSVERVTLAGAGHMMQRHRPRELAALLVDFLAT